MVGCGELTDATWAAISPVPAPVRRHRRDHRRAINGILRQLRTGAQQRAPQHAAGPRSKGALRGRPAARHRRSEGRRRSRGGLTTKLHLACDGKGWPLPVVLTAGQRRDSTQPEPLLDATRVPGQAGPHHPRRHPDRLIA